MNARVVRLLQRSSDRLQKNQKQQLYQQQQQQHSDGGDSSGSEPPKAPRRKRRDCAAGVKAKLETESNNARALSLPLCCALSFPLSCALPLALSHFNDFCAFRCLLSFAQAASASAAASVSVATLRVSYAACVAVHVGSAACGSVVNFRFSIKATAAPPTAQSALCLL